MWTQRVPYIPICVWACEHVNTEGALYTNMCMSLWECEHRGWPIYQYYVSLWACEHRGCSINQYVCELVSMWTHRVPYICQYVCDQLVSMWIQRVPYIPICMWACEHVNTEGALYTNMCASLWACEHRGCPIYTNMCVSLCMHEHVNTESPALYKYYTIMCVSLWACEHTERVP